MAAAPPPPGAVGGPSQQPPQNMPAPASMSGALPGLEYLTQIDQLMVHQQIEVLELFTALETQNKYLVKNSLGQQVYFAAEDSNFCARQYIGPLRPFQMKILDNTQKEVIHLIRPYRCTGWCCFCCLQELEVQSPPGTTVGWVKQDCSFIYPSFSIQNADGETVLKIKGPCCTCQWCDVEFQVLSSDESTEVGKITKQFSGLAKECFTLADNFGIQFPMDLDVKIKAVLLGACFLIDLMFFEKRKNNCNNTG